MNEKLIKDILAQLANESQEVLKNREVEHEVSFTITAKGVVKKGEDYEQVISFGLPYDKIIAVLLSKLNGVTIEAVVREALESDLDDTEIKARASKALETIKGKGKRNCSGKLTSSAIQVLDSSVDICRYC